ncbi:MAG TPA: hypothetical protein VGR47_18450 [Terracidiphilus sp.]|nr:hypothetical protein [Terracidiphilus sp.]
MMRKLLIAVGLLTATGAVYAAPPAENNWRAEVVNEIPLLGHRNWILIVDSAYPLQISPGIETIETDEPMLGVAHFVLGRIETSIHVTPDIYMDAELPFVSDQDAPDTSAYRRSVGDLLRGYHIASEPHDKLIAQVAGDGNTFHVLVLKTTGTIPYSSIFIHLNCKYWSDDAEQRLRARMAGRAGDQ